MGVISDSNSFHFSLEQDCPDLPTKFTPESGRPLNDQVTCEDRQAEGVDCHLVVPMDGDDLEMVERSEGIPAESTACLSLNDRNDNLDNLEQDGINASSKGFLKNNSLSDKHINKSAAVNQSADPSLNQENGTLSITSGSFTAVSGEFGSSKDLNVSPLIPSVSLSENGLHSACEPEGVEIGNSRIVSNPLVRLSLVETDVKFSDVNSSKDENTTDNNVSTSEGGGSAEYGAVCTYQVCLQCLYSLYHLTHKLLVQEWGLNSSHWTVEDVHDAVASLSVDLISAVRKLYLAKDLPDLSNKTDEKLGASLDCSNLRTCNPGNPVVPAECISHSTGHHATESTDMALNEPVKLDFKFIFRDGVLVHMDPDKDASLHCKFETLCLCSVRELIVMTKRPFG